MEKLTATFRVNTPMFIGGADPANSPPELRVPSIKGALRFWWRALSYSRVGSDIKRLAQEEAALFGSSDGEVGQSKVLLSLAGTEFPKPVSSPELNFQSYGGMIYLGYGVINFRGELQRKCLPQNFTFTLNAVVRPQPKSSTNEKLQPSNIESQLVEAIKAMSYFGGLGSKSRKGYGSVSLESLQGNTDYHVPRSIEDLKHELSLFLKQSRAGRADYTAFSSVTRIWCSQVYSDPLTLLNDVGKGIQLYRSYGKNGKVGSAQSKRIFRDDHDTIKQFLEGKRVNKVPQRVVFGLPHNYFFSSNMQGPKKASIEHRIVGEGQDSKGKRRASPLFIHIHCLGERQYVAVMALFPTRFLPEDAEIAIKVGDGKARERSQSFAAKVDYAVIENMMTKEFFPGITEVRP